ncbi:EspA family secreted protein [Aeromonas diversa CDC 2478-85]|uniref:EspA family secreted protein n=1 Tax=Aeromonas diversa CDC 2478-85 TaxID=1268237 RepID=N9V7J4_9GAMM|nr:EspA family secreted protein [Aeromonas diversa]ENY71202.1 EspA family secreted protein [Aeromonas diversa CDC 2478-85]
MTFATHFAGSPPIAAGSGYDAYVDRKAREGDNLMSEGISVLYKFMTLFSDLAQVRYDQMSAKADRARDSQQAANQVDAILSKLAKADDKAALPPDVVQYLRDHHIAITVQNDGKNSTSDIDSWLRANNPASPYLDKLLGYIAQSGPLGMRSDQWQDVVRYMDDHNVRVDGQRCCDYIWGLPEVGMRSYQNVSKEHMQHIADTLKNASAGLDKGQLDVIKGALETDSGRCSDFVTQAQLQIQKTMQSYNVCVSLVNSMQTLLAEMNKSIAQNIR